jgi:hypothetical protein
MTLCKHQSGLIQNYQQRIFTSATKAADFSAKDHPIKNNQFARCITFKHRDGRSVGDLL